MSEKIHVLDVCGGKEKAKEKRFTLYCIQVLAGLLNEKKNINEHGKVLWYKINDF